MPMRQATLDLLDADLTSHSMHYTTASQVDRVKFYTRQFLFDPNAWAALFPLITQHALSWGEFKFKDVVDANDIDARIPSDDPGLYLFFVRPDNLIHLFPQFVLYVGISNDRGSDRPLRQRLRDYFTPSQVRKRKNVHQMLQLYYEYVWVAFAHLVIPSVDMLKLEKNVHDFLGPPFGRSGYSAGFKSSRSAWDL